MITRLISYELRKVFSSSFVIILALILLLLNVILCAYFSYSPPSVAEVYINRVLQLYYDDPQYYFSEYERLKNEYDHTDPFSGTLSSAYSGGRYDDIGLFDAVYDIISADDKYHERIDNVIMQANGICNNYEKAGRTDSYVYSYHKYVIERYSYLYENVRLDDAPVSGWNRYFGYNADYFVVFILITVVCVHVALSDRTSGFYSIASTCENGRTKTAIAKLTSALLLSAVIVVLFTAVTFVTSGIATGGYSDFRNAAQAISRLELLPLHLSFGGALAVNLGLKLLSASLYCMLLFAIVIILKQTVLAVGVGIGMMFLNYFVSALDEVAAGQWKYLNLRSVYNIDQYAARYRSVDISGHSVGLTIVLMLIVVCLVAAVLFISCVLYAKNGLFTGIGMPRVFVKAAKRSRVMLGMKKYRSRGFGSNSLVIYEIYKQRIIYIALAVIIVVKVIITSGYYKPHQTMTDMALKSYINEIGGPYSEEKASYISEEYDSCLYIISQFDDIRNDWWYGEISDGLYNRLFSEYMSAMTNRDALAYLQERSEYLGELYDRGIVGSYIYDTGYYAYMDQGVDWLLLLFVAVLCCRSYLYEHTKTQSRASMLALANVTELGRQHLFICKAAVSIMSSAFAWYAFKMIDLFFLLRSYEMPDLASPVLSMPRYGETLFNLTISEYIIITVFVSLLGTLLIAAMCFCMGLLMKRALFVYAMAAVVLTVPYFAGLTGVTSAGYFDLTLLYETDRLYRLSPASMSAPLYCICFGAVILCGVITAVFLSMRKTEKGDWI